MKLYVGEVFCYLFLRIKIGLLVYINGCFVVILNRKEIWKIDIKGRWNIIFMRYVVVKVYLEVFSVFRDLVISGELVDYIYYVVWFDFDFVYDDFFVIC